MEKLRLEYQHGLPVVLPSGTVVSCVPSARDLIIQAASGCVNVGIQGPLAKSVALAEEKAASVEAAAALRSKERFASGSTVKSDHTGTKYGGDMTGGILDGLHMVVKGQKRKFGEKMAKSDAKRRKAQGKLQEVYEKVSSDYEQVEGVEKSVPKLNMTNMKAVVDAVIAITGDKFQVSKGWKKSAASVSLEFKKALKHCGADSARDLPWKLLFSTLGEVSDAVDDEDDLYGQGEDVDYDDDEGYRSQYEDESDAEDASDDEEAGEGGACESDDEVDCTQAQSMAGDHFKKRPSGEVATPLDAAPTEDTADGGEAALGRVKRQCKSTYR
jgi:hypothetical protein